MVIVSSSHGTECVTSAQAGFLCVCVHVCVYVCLPVKREKWKEWNSKLTKALKCPSSLKNMEFFLLLGGFLVFLHCCFFCCLQLQDQGAVPVCNAHGTLQLLQLLKHFTHGFLHCSVLSFLSSLCGITDHKMVLPKTWGSACLVCTVNSSARQSGTDKVRFLGYLL